MSYVVKTGSTEIHAPSVEDIKTLLTLLNIGYAEDKQSKTSDHLVNEGGRKDERADSEAVQGQPQDDRTGSEISSGEWLSRAAAEARAQGPDAASWSFTGIWNKSLEEPEPRTYEPRERIWASELGKPLVDVYLKLKGVEPSNHPNPRSLRKFEAGNIWEWIISLILKRAGILQSTQDRVVYQYDNMLEVSGKMDFVAGGTVATEGLAPGASYYVSNDALLSGLPGSFHRGASLIMEHLAKHPSLTVKPLELKSLSSFMFEGLERSGRALAQHRLQLFHYLKATGFPMGTIVYICRDDCRMMEFNVRLDDQAVELEYKTYIEAISEYYYKDEMPPLEEPIVFNEDLGRFSKNNGVAWSPYLTKLYGIADQAEFDEKYQKTPERWNRVLGRAKTNKAMTKKNLEVIEEIRAAGFDIDAILAKLTVTADEATEE